MTKISTNYFLITQNTQDLIEDITIQDAMEFNQLTCILEELLFREEPSDEVISRILKSV